ncbi:protein-ADP-ribose hydrolase [Ursidibacter sp. B-7004-1]
MQHKITKLIEYLDERIAIPSSLEEQQNLLRALMNIRPPQAESDAFWQLQDEVLQSQVQAKGVVSLADLTPVRPNIYLWQGDITRLQVGAIVNAANSQLLGCFHPLHRCIDNAIHSQAGLQLRLACAEKMQAQGHLEPTGKAKITPAYNLPSDYVIHTVGPIIRGALSEQDCQLLAECYRSCLTLAVEHKVQSIAFCCISTGEFCFPNDKAAQIAIQTVKDFSAENTQLTVIFNVFKDIDLQLYQHLLGVA